MIFLPQVLALKRGDLHFSVYSPIGGTPEARLMAKVHEPIKIELVCFSGILCKARVMTFNSAGYVHQPILQLAFPSCHWDWIIAAAQWTLSVNQA